VVLGELGRLEEAVAVYGRLVADYVTDPAPVVQEVLMHAREALRESGRGE